MSSDGACLDPTVIVYVGSLNLLFLPGGYGQRESDNPLPTSTLIRTGVRMSFKEMEQEREKERKNGRVGGRDRELKKTATKHIRTEKRRVNIVFKGLQFPSSLCDVTEATL